MAMAGDVATMHGFWPSWKYSNGPYFLAIFARYWCMGNMTRRGRDAMEAKMGGRGGKFLCFVNIDVAIR